MGPCELCSGRIGVEKCREKMRTAACCGPGEVTGAVRVAKWYRERWSCEVVQGALELRSGTGSVWSCEVVQGALELRSGTGSVGWSCEVVQGALELRGGTGSVGAATILLF